MDSNLLKVFVAVANNKSVSLGAKELGFAQSNVTSRIKQLEKNLGFSLFHRVPKGVILNKEGENCSLCGAKPEEKCKNEDI